jgi:hypothetical protein
MTLIGFIAFVYVGVLRIWSSGGQPVNFAGLPDVHLALSGVFPMLIEPPLIPAFSVTQVNIAQPR